MRTSHADTVCVHPGRQGCRAFRPVTTWATCVVPKGVMMFGTRSLKSLSVTAVLAGSLLLGGGGMVLAQDEAATDVAFPNHIHAGTCDDLDPNPAAPLTDITPWLNETDDETENEPQGVLT